MTINSDPQLNDADMELLSAYIDRRLDDGERAALEQRLSDEPALRVALDELRATVTLLRELEPLKPPRSFTIAAPAAASRRAWSFPWSAFGSGLVAMVCLLAFSVVLLRGGGPTSAPQSAGVAAAPTAAAAAAPAAADRLIQPAAAAPTIAPAAAEAPEAAVTAAPASAMGAAAAPTAGPAVAEAAPTTSLVSTEMAVAQQPNGAAPGTAADSAIAQATSEPAAPAGGVTVVQATPAPAQPESATSELTALSETPEVLPFNQPTAAPTANSAPAGGSTNLGLIAGAIVLALLVGAGVGLALRRRG